MKRNLLAWLLLISPCSLGCVPPGKPERPVAADKVSDFVTLYRTNCSGCHGADGKGGPAPPLNDPLFLAIVPDETLLTIIKSGRKVHAAQKTAMPAFASTAGGPLTDAQVEVLAKGIKVHWKEPSSTKGAPPPYLGAKAGGGQKEGQTVYATACAGCHGDKGQGGKSGNRMVGALNDPAFVGLISDQALRRIMITGRPDLGMPAFDETRGRPADFQPLTSAQIDDVVAFLASWRISTVTSGK